jgi:hypothetical protein
MVLLYTEEIKVVISKKSVNLIYINVIHRFLSFELMDTFRFRDISLFLEFISQLIKGEVNKFSFPQEDGEHDLMWEFLETFKKSEFLLRIFFYKRKVKCSLYIDKKTLIRFYHDLKIEYNM